ncbi:MAG: homocysteine biosynthesis protein [Candidatus Methanomethylophilaceae archaeon]|nr:homocysteine biosynthesis protein [Candidatus Methanomethylophilaceae archaeon]
MFTAEEVLDLVEDKGIDAAFEEVDVVTTGTFGAMCSSGAFLNFGHSEPPIRMAEIHLNDVQAYGGLAAVDTYIGATQASRSRPTEYGGAHVIEDLVAGKPIHLEASSPGSDCYPRKEIDTYVSLETVNEAYIYNPRNSYQNYAAASNSSDKTLFTYMGKLLPKNRNITFSSAGQLSPLLNDPHCRTIGVGTHIFLGGGEGYVAWQGTQFNTSPAEKNGVPTGSARNLALIGDMRGMSTEYLRALNIHNYSISLAVGVGIPIPILDKEMMRACSIRDEDIVAPVLDYSVGSSRRPVLAHISYEQFRSGTVELEGKSVRTSSLSSYKKARDIALELKKWIEDKEFLLTEPVRSMPVSSKPKPLQISTKEELE